MSAATEQWSQDQSLLPANQSSVFPSERNGSTYGNVNVAPNARVHLGDVIQYIQTTNDPNVAMLPSQALLDDFVQENIDLVERFDQRMHALKSSITSDNAAKSQALRNIGDEIRNLEHWMTQNKSKLERARQSHDTYTAETTDASVRILMAMNQALHNVLEALATSLETQSRTEAERLEKEQMLREIENSQQNLSNSVDMACDSLQAAGKVMQVLPGSQRPEMQRAGKIMDDSAFGMRMFKKFAAFANKGRDEERPSGGNYGYQQRSQPRTMTSTRPYNQEQRGDSFQPTANSRIPPRRVSPAGFDENGDDPSKRPGLPPRRPQNGQLFVGQHDVPVNSQMDEFLDNRTQSSTLNESTDTAGLHSSRTTVPRSRMLGDSNGWELQHLLPPPTRISRSPQPGSIKPKTMQAPPLSHSTELSRVASAPQTNSISRGIPPPLPARAPALPPRPSRPGPPNREILSDPGPIPETEETVIAPETTAQVGDNTKVQAASMANSSIKSELSLRLASLGQTNGYKALPTATFTSTPSQNLSAPSFPRMHSSLPPSPPLSLSPPPSLPSSPPSVNSRPTVPSKPKRLASTMSKPVIEPTITRSALNTTSQLAPQANKVEDSSEETPTLSFAQKKAMFGAARG